MFSICQNDLYKSLEYLEVSKVSRGVFKTHSKIYDGAFLEKQKAAIST